MSSSDGCFTTLRLAAMYPDWAKREFGLGELLFRASRRQLGNYPETRLWRIAGRVGCVVAAWGHGFCVVGSRIYREAWSRILRSWKWEKAHESAAFWAKTDQVSRPRHQIFHHRQNPASHIRLRGSIHRAVCEVRTPVLTQQTDLAATYSHTCSCGRATAHSWCRLTPRVMSRFRLFSLN